MQLYFETAFTPQGWAKQVLIEIDAGSISGIRSGVERPPVCPRYEIGLPGMPNLHSHAFQRGFAGLAERRPSSGKDDFWGWRQIMYQFANRIGPDDLEAIAALAFSEMLEGGFTHVGEFHYLHRAPDGQFYSNPAAMADHLAAAAEEAGIGLTLLPVFYAHAGFGGKTPEEHQQRFVSNPGEFAKLVDGCRRAVDGLRNSVVGIAPHSLRAVVPSELKEILPLAEGGPIHIHIAEQRREVEECIAWSGLPPVAWLMDNAPVDQKWCLVHATHIDQSELRSITLSGSVVGLCPITEANLGDGIFPLKAFREIDGRFGIGSDSNVLINAAEELRLLEYGQRLTERVRNVTSSATIPSAGRSLFTNAVEGGAQALGIKSGLDAGRAADIIALNAGHSALASRSADALLDSYIFSGTAGIVADVWRGGAKVVSEGRHIRRDEITVRYRKVLENLLSD